MGLKRSALRIYLGQILTVALLFQYFFFDEIYENMEKKSTGSIDFK